MNNIFWQCFDGLQSTIKSIDILSRLKPITISKEMSYKDFKCCHRCYCHLSYSNQKL